MKKESIIGGTLFPLTLATPPDTIAIRSDAAWDSTTNRAGLGWVIISSSGNQTFKASRNCVASPLTAEGLALREAVRTCAKQGLQKVHFESDSVQLIKAVRDDVPISEIYSVVADIVSHTSGLSYVSFSWITREKNVLADRLAKDALNVTGTLVVGDAVSAHN